MTTSVMWFRRDLRLGDHPALLAAATADRVLPLFVLDPALLASGGARTARLAGSLAALHTETDGALVIRSGDPVAVVPAVAAEVGAREVHVSRESTPYGRRRDEGVADRLRADGASLVATGSPYAAGPGSVRTGQGGPYRIFTPFSRAWRAQGWAPPAGRPATRWRTGVPSESLDGPTDLAEVGERTALERWEAFLEEELTSYGHDRDRPDLDATSRMSIPLKYGEVHPRTLLADLSRRRSAATAGSVDRFVMELAWREFYADVLWHDPRSAWQDWRDELRGMPYEDEPGLVDAWRSGRTGYPFVDAGMRQLRAEGWMHNRLRMVTASFLVKDLHTWWPVGARHFLEHLLDGDLASNNHGWQWVAGTGTDAAPYFRIFNPVTQGLRFDPDGDYVRRWVPELRHLAGAAAHEPWRHASGYAHGYSQRIVDHAEERREALARLAEAKGRRP
ncbi:MAG: cryptochrome/photolyase family protein [Intrasporangium sp.]|uniref:cryptochrome/photolyase family protein n=1 Tax=Intrasporangium sp. TaxID=1925024 RepID=UPI003F7E831D